MEHYQTTQNRAMQTIAVADEHLPGVTVGGITTAALASLANNMDAAASTRDMAVATADQAENAENLNSLFIRRLVLALPQAARAELDEEVPVEAGLLDLLDVAFGITPRTTELRMERGKKVSAALVKINAFLAAHPPRQPVTAGGKGLADLTAAMAAQPTLEQAVETAAADVTSARIALDGQDHAVDRLNKRFYIKLQAEARSNPALAAALAQIDTETDNLPGTLSILSVLQGGSDELHLLISYVNGTGADADERLLDWMILGVDTSDFPHTEPADPSGNTLGPFTAGQTIRLRTRTVNSSGTRTSAMRQIVIQEPE